MKNKVTIYFGNEQEIYTVTYKLKMLIRRAVLATLEEEHFENDCEVSFTFTDNENIHILNRQYRDVDRATDVLSFPLLDFDDHDDDYIAEPTADEPVRSLGDIVLSLERAGEQADEYGHSFEREVAFFTVHSMLHLLGYDHITDDEDMEMRECQRRIMDRLSLGV